ncbi:MAG: AAA family ATPase [Raoultibacter sp.]
MSVKITSFEAENVKRVKAISLEPAANGLTVIGGRNAQGKTSVLDAIAWAVGGGRFRPTEAKREGSSTDPHLKVTLSNGLVVERKGKNSELKVIDPEGRKSGQALLDGFVEQLALDLPKFMLQNDTDKAKTLLNIIGVGDQLYALEQQEQVLYNQRTTLGQMRDQKRGAADEMPVYPDAPSEPVSAAELIEQQQAILAKNGENQRLRDQVPQLERIAKELAAEATRQQGIMEAARIAMEQADAELAKNYSQLTTAKKTVEQLRDEATDEIEASLAAIDQTNAKVRTNAAKAAAEREANELVEQYTDMNNQIGVIRAQKLALLQNADLPLEGLSVEDGVLVYNGREWDCMSSAEQLRVATAIVRKLNPECGFVLVDRLEQMDVQTMAEFGAWAETEGLQVIATRVSTGDECSILIEDGYGKPAGVPATVEPVFEAAVADMVASDAKWVM